MLPVFAAGVDFETTLPAGAAAGQSAFAVPGASLYLAQGDPVFIAGDDGSAPEFLGPAVSVGADSIATAFPLRTARAPGARLWTPEHAYVFPVPPDPPIRRPVETGVETLVTAGGSAVQTRTASPVMHEQFTVRGLTRAAWEALLVWLESATDWGLYPFLYVDANRVVRTARLTATPVLQAETAPNLFSVTFTLLL
ncbi:MAG: hypothetical protein Kow0059_15760 [Candidatus Sumerlaeia bacterium]